MGVGLLFFFNIVLIKNSSLAMKLTREAFLIQRRLWMLFKKIKPNKKWEEFKLKKGGLKYEIR